MEILVIIVGMCISVSFRGIVNLVMKDSTNAFFKVSFPILLAIIYLLHTLHPLTWTFPLAMIICVVSGYVLALKNDRTFIYALLMYALGYCIFAWSMLDARGWNTDYIPLLACTALGLGVSIFYVVSIKSGLIRWLIPVYVVTMSALLYSGVSFGLLTGLGVACLFASDFMIGYDKFIAKIPLSEFWIESLYRVGHGILCIGVLLGFNLGNSFVF